MKRRTFLLVGLVLWCVGCDQGTKRLAEHALKYREPMTFLRGSVQLFYAENTGAFGSLGEHWPHWLKLFAFIVLPVFVLAASGYFVLKNAATDRTMLVAYGLVIGGGLGNMVDRIGAGYVVDFMYLRAGPLATNVFNVADLALVAGLILIVLHRPKRAEEPPISQAPA